MSKEYDVIVCGGGPAGIGAAAASAYSGAKTLLVEYCNSLGGMGTGCRVSCWVDTRLGPFGSYLKKIMLRDGFAEVIENKQRFHEPGRLRFDQEAFKAIVAEKLHELGCEILYGTVAESVYQSGNQARGIYSANKNGRKLIRSSVVVDATADGQLAVDAGAEFMKGDPEDKRLQHVNFRMDVENVDIQSLCKLYGAEKLRQLFKDGRKSGELSVPNGIFSPPAETFPIKDDQPIFRQWEVEGVDCSEAEQVSNTLLDCQIAAIRLLRFCRKHLPGHENMRISRFHELLGTRESRRIAGHYILTGEDVLNAKKFDDGVAEANFWIDFHDSPPGTTIPYSLEYIRANRPEEGDWYEIPYRCLVPKHTRGILVAGRCISSDRGALASLRGQPTCMFTGTAAGIAAAMCVNKQICPGALEGVGVREKIKSFEY